MPRFQLPDALTMLIFGCFMMPLSADGQTQYRFDAKTGQSHPDFDLPSIDDGEIIKFSDFRGKKVLLVHFASW